LALGIEVDDSGMDRLVESVDVVESLMGEEMLFEVAPSMFDIVQFGGILRQPFDAQSWPVGEGGP